MKIDDLRVLQGGYYEDSKPYRDLGKDLTASIYVHDMTDDLVLIVQSGDSSQLIEMEMTFSDAMVLIKALQDAIERKPPHIPFQPAKKTGP